MSAFNESRYAQLPSLSGLLAFHAVGRLKSFTKASRELHVTQGAVSHRIKALEAELGVSLFVRLPRRVDLTDQGRVLLAAVDDALGRLGAGLAELREVANEHRVAVSCSPSFAIRWLVPRLGELRDGEEDLEVHVSADDRLVEPGAGGVDVCIRFGAGGYAGFTEERLTVEDVHAVASPLYVETHDVRTVADLDRCTLLHADVLAERSGHVGWSEWYRALGRVSQTSYSGTHFNHAHMALEAATAGQGVALGRTTITGDAIASGRLVRLFEPAVRCGFSYWLVTPKRRRQRPAVSRFRDWLQKQLAADAG